MSVTLTASSCCTTAGWSTRGTHDQLIERGGLYKTWYDLQRIGYIDDI